MNSKPKSQLFIDGGDAEETRQANQLLKTKKPEWGIGIQGQTTNPTLVSKNPEVQSYLAAGKKLTPDEALAEYRKIVQSVAEVTKGPISIQVLADQETKAEEMLSQANVYREWIPNYVVKFPCTGEGLRAAESFCQEGPVNLTLNFSQEQAAAVYSATRQAKYRVFISPFVGRLDDRNENGMDVVKNELQMFQKGDGHVEVLTASVRNINHLLYAWQLESPAITIPLKIFQEWAERDFVLPDVSYVYDSGDLKSIPYQKLTLTQDWRKYDLRHDLTDIGLAKFMADWRGISG